MMRLLSQVKSIYLSIYLSMQKKVKWQTKPSSNDHYEFRYVFGAEQSLLQTQSGPAILCTPLYIVGRVFANGLGDLGLNPGRVIPKTLKIVLDTSLLNTRQYKVRIEGKVEQSSERSSALLYTLW